VKHSELVLKPKDRGILKNQGPDIYTVTGFERCNNRRFYRLKEIRGLFLRNSLSIAPRNYRNDQPQRIRHARPCNFHPLSCITHL
jgi:hypothetical protein